MYELFVKRIGKSLIGIFAVFCVIVSVSSVFGQVTAGNLQGMVTDPNGAVVAGATVRLTNPESGFVRETTTSSEELYNFTSLQPSERYV